ncbi:MAG: hypothetical protein GY750_03495 [Lentisphaerae bacterium]|nr:hypothetical protein [Lentisphaerota bacterium]
MTDWIPRQILAAVCAVIMLVAGACGASFVDEAEDARQQAETNVDDLADALGYEELYRYTRSAGNPDSWGFGEGQEGSGIGSSFGRSTVELQGPARGDDPANLAEVAAAIEAGGYKFVADGCGLNDVSAVVTNGDDEAILVSVNAYSGRITLLAQTSFDHQQLQAEEVDFQPEEPGCWTSALN